jgi:predicted  nucleic acid-binding Zn-ribbon protein
VRGIELEIEQIKQRSRQNESEAEQRMKQIEARTKQIESETEQLRHENANVKELNAKGRALLSCIDQHCFPPECSSIPPQQTEIDCGPSSP